MYLAAESNGVGQRTAAFLTRTAHIFRLPPTHPTWNRGRRPEEYTRYFAYVHERCRPI